MKYLPNSSIRYDTNFTDEVLSTEWNESELENDDLKNYKAKQSIISGSIRIILQLQN